jgi:hypothetical protein
MKEHKSRPGQVTGHEQIEGAGQPETPIDSATSDVLAWQMIEQGRYMPRRIRGSFRGRELG